MTVGLFLAGLILLGLGIAQIYKVYKADKEYKKTLEEFYQLQKKKIK